jgi:flagellar hook-associated protein 1 FlgK
MASMASLARATSGLLSNQRALHATAHNLSNVNTPGFTRQQVVFRDASYVTIGANSYSALQVGLGTDIQVVRQVRDPFLDAAYRSETSRQGYYYSNYQAVVELENILGEIHGESFSKSMDDLWNAINELAKQPEGLETRGLFVQSARAFIDSADLIMNQINEYQLNLNQQIKDTVKEINGLGDTIRDLNEKIARAEINGENANDYRDQRNVALDRLAHLADISYKEDASGRVNVILEGRSFVNDGYVQYIELAQAEERSPLVKPVWSGSDGSDVFNLDTVISVDKDNDKGLLKGLLIARGSRAGNYTDMEAGKFEDIQGSVVMTAQAQFDNLVHNVVTMINDLLAPVDPLTNQLSDEAPIGLDGSSGTEIFVRKYYDRFDTNGDLIPVDPDDPYTWYATGNLTINPEILSDYNLIPLSKDLASIGDNSFVNKMIKAWEENLILLEPTATTGLSFNEYYASFVSELGHKGQMAYNMQSNQEMMVTQLDNYRLSLMGVSSDEELSNMMQYQHAYNASAKVVAAVDEMLEHLITRVGIVGR